MTIADKRSSDDQGLTEELSTTQGQLGFPVEPGTGGVIGPIRRPPVKDEIVDPASGRQIRISGKRLTATSVLDDTVRLMKSLQRRDGYWWFALEANETIGAEFIFLMHYLGEVDPEVLKGISRRILDVQRADGTWALYHEGPADLSTTVECYFALKLAGMDTQDPRMLRAREYILSAGGAEKSRVFTRIHLAMFGLVPWDAAPAMPAEFIFLPSWSYISIYSFSSWARATIVPLLIFVSQKKVERLPDNFTLDEIFLAPTDKRNYSFNSENGFFSIENFFIQIDRLLKRYEKNPLKKIRAKAIRRCSDWIWERVQRCEDIYPPLAYCAFAHRALGYPNDDPRIRRPFNALKMFQQRYATADVPALPPEIRDNGETRPSDLREAGIDPRTDSSEVFASHESQVTSHGISIHQQCCISPVWDTPWMIEALLEAGVSPSDPALLRATRWLMKRQITGVRGDWSVKNPRGKPGGWSFEFENDYYPDVDDTIQVLTALCRVSVPWRDKEKAVMTGIDWLISMQNDDGGWGAFDRNQNRTLVNRIPFSDHRACLDPSSPDITGRMVEFLMRRNYSTSHPAVRKALDYLWETQEEFGAWFARWGINYIYGTWCVLTALAAMGMRQTDSRVAKAVAWLESVQKPDGGFSEAADTYHPHKPFECYSASVPSQTAWALMAFTAGGAVHSRAAARAALHLINSRNSERGWDEMHYTGTGFPLHFYIRYHGYRHYFPLLALGRYFRAGGTCEAIERAGGRVSEVPVDAFNLKTSIRLS
ncbi:MAG: squalene--hopene cyclase [Proteobacteria bacterium]|nr:squalene--hopene cyclase [Pseudomonadota bacterium]